MNYAAVQQAMSMSLPSTQHHLLLILAGHARRDGHVFVSVADLARTSGHSDRSVRRALEELERAGLIARSTRYAPGRRLSNSYELLFLPADAKMWKSQTLPVTVTARLAAKSAHPTGQADRYYIKEVVDGDDREGVSRTEDVENPLHRPLDQLTPDQKRQLMRRA